MVNLYKLKFTVLQQEILRLLFIKAGQTFTARALAQQLDVSSPAILKSLPLLEKEGLIVVEKDKESKRLSIALQREDHRVIWLKRADNLKQLYESGLVQFFYDHFPAATIILFGSYAFGEDTFSSDIDIAIIGSKEKHVDLNNFEKMLERKIIVHYYLDFTKIPKHLANNIYNGK